MASAVDIGIAEGAAGVLAAVGSGVSLITRIGFGQRADRRADYGFGAVVALLAAGSTGFALLASDSSGLFVAGAVIAFAIGWGWPGLFNLAVVDLNREAPGAATGVTQTGIYVGAAARAAGVRPAVDRDRLLGRLAGVRSALPAGRGGVRGGGPAEHARRASAEGRERPDGLATVRILVRARRDGRGWVGGTHYVPKTGLGGFKWVYRGPTPLNQTTVQAA